MSEPLTLSMVVMSTPLPTQSLGLSEWTRTRCLTVSAEPMSESGTLAKGRLTPTTSDYWGRSEASDPTETWRALRRCLECLTIGNRAMSYFLHNRGLQRERQVIDAIGASQTFR